MRSRAGRYGLLAAGFLLLATVASAQHIPAPKLDLIRQAMAAMNLDSRIEGMVAHQVDGRVQRLRIENPDAPDSLVAEARDIIAAVYAANLDGPRGLMPRVYAIIDRRLTEEDLRFAVNFRGSDQGRRYRELMPRVVQESLDASRDWLQRQEPEIGRRLHARFAGRLK